MQLADIGELASNTAIVCELFAMPEVVASLPPEAVNHRELVSGYHRVLESDCVSANVHHWLSAEFTCLCAVPPPARDAVRLPTCEKLLMQHSEYAIVDRAVGIEEQLGLLRFWLLESGVRIAHFELRTCGTPKT
jgi:hypothetical protein